MGAEHLVLHHLREAQDGVERRAQLVAHGGEEAGFGEVGLLGAPARLVGIGLGLFQLAEDRVLLGPGLQGRDRRGVEVVRQEQEEQLRADRHADEQDRFRLARQDQERRGGGAERQEAGIGGERDRRGEHRGHGGHDDEDEHHEGAGVRRLDLEQHQHEEGPGDALERLAEDHPPARDRQRQGGRVLAQEGARQGGVAGDRQQHAGAPGPPEERGRPEHRGRGDAAHQHHQRQEGADPVLGVDAQQLVIEGALEPDRGGQPLAGGADVAGDLAPPGRLLRRRAAPALNHFRRDFGHRSDRAAPSPPRAAGRSGRGSRKVVKVLLPKPHESDASGRPALPLRDARAGALAHIGHACREYRSSRTQAGLEPFQPLVGSAR